MESLNRVCLIGNVGGDPVIKMFNNGNPHAAFSVATSSTWKDKATGEKKSSTEWHRIVCFSSGLCAIIQQYVKKGSHVYIEGSLKTREWDGPDGQKKSITEVNLNDFNSKLIILNKKDEENIGYTPPIDSKENNFIEQKKAQWDLDDEIPF